MCFLLDARQTVLSSIHGDGMNKTDLHSWSTCKLIIYDAKISIMMKQSFFLFMLSSLYNESESRTL